MPLTARPYASKVRSWPARRDRFIGFYWIYDLEEAQNGSKAANNLAP